MLGETNASTNIFDEAASRTSDSKSGLIAFMTEDEVEQTLNSYDDATKITALKNIIPVPTENQLHRLNEQVEQFFEIEDPKNVKPIPARELLELSKESMSKNDKLALKVMRDTCEFKEGHYWIGIPFENAEEQPDMPDSRPQALWRMKKLRQRFLKNSH